MSDALVPAQNALTSKEETQVSWPVARMELVFAACDPGEQLEPGDPRYADFQVLRQGVGIESIKQDLLTPQPHGSYHHGCLCGHRGSGKSTELLELKAWADQHGFLAVRTEVDEYYGLIPLEPSDLFLLAATTVEKALQQFGHPLSKDSLKPIVQWFAEVVQEDKEDIKSELKAEAEAQAKGGFFSFINLSAKFLAGVQAASSHAKTTREKIRNYPGTLADLTAQLLADANQILADNGKPNGLLLLFDNLDRYPPEIIDRVLFRNSELMRRLACHAVFTMPIALEYDPLSPAIQDAYGFPTVLPMLTLRRKSDSWTKTVAESSYIPEAVRIVREALARRIVIEALFENQQDADLLIKMSGGCIRDLIHLMRLAFRHSSGAERFSATAIQKAIREMRGTYIRRLSAADYTQLAAIARREPIDRKEIRRLLFDRFALEYLDENDVPWIDVHPLVIEIDEFQSTYQSQSPLRSS